MTQNVRPDLVTYRSVIFVSLFALSACSGNPVAKLMKPAADDPVTLAIKEVDGEGEAMDDVPVDVPPARTRVTPKRSGLLGNIFGSRSVAQAVPDVPQVTADTLLPFGQIGPNCTVTSAQMGRKVDENAGYEIYDTNPSSASVRTHYITGFKDNCARQFSASTALMGDIGTHEVVRYLPSNAKHAYSAADNAYEQLKAAYCGAARGKTCGPKLDAFARRTTFITAYESFEDNAEWADMLLYNGEVAAMGPVAR